MTGDCADSAPSRCVIGRRALIVSAGIGAGQDGAVRELAVRLRRQGFTVDCHDYLDLLPGRLGAMLRAAYMWQLRTVPRTWGWLLSLVDMLRPLAVLVAALVGRAGRPAMLEIIRRGPDPDVVISTYPLASQLLGALRRRGDLDTPVVTFLTDMSVHRLWVSRGVDLHLALHALPAGQARVRGARRVLVTAPAVPAAFARPVPSALPVVRVAVVRQSRGARGRVITRRSRGVIPRPRRGPARQLLGLPADAVIALVVAGSLGIGEVERTARDIAASGEAVPVVVCGHNDGLAARLAEVPGVVVLGWVHDMARLIQASDIVVQNAGGLSSLEALVAGIPVVSYRCIPGRGRTNAAALNAAGLARWIREPHELGAALRAAVRERRAGTLGTTPPESAIEELAIEDLASSPRAVPVGVPLRRWMLR